MAERQGYFHGPVRVSRTHYIPTAHGVKAQLGHKEATEWMPAMSAYTANLPWAGWRQSDHYEARPEAFVGKDRRRVRDGNI